jgi:hypothetical protein
MSDAVIKGAVSMMISDAYSKIKRLERENEKLTQQLADRDALILELEKMRDFYCKIDNWFHDSIDHDDLEEIGATKLGVDIIMKKGGKLARTPLKNQKLLDEIKGK